VNVGLFAVLGVLGELLLQPDAIRASENMAMDVGFMHHAPALLDARSSVLVNS
jgi:hypothetical protein